MLRVRILRKQETCSKHDVARVFNGKLTSSYKRIDQSNILMQYIKCLEYRLFNKEKVQHTKTI